MQRKAGARSAADEQAIRKAVAAYAEAMNKGDLQARLACWAADAEYIDEAGKVTRGAATPLPPFSNTGWPLAAKRFPSIDSVDLAGEFLPYRKFNVRVLKEKPALSQFRLKFAKNSLEALDSPAVAFLKYRWQLGEA
jgi:hypothetical protein